MPQLKAHKAGMQPLAASGTTRRTASRPWRSRKGTARACYTGVFYRNPAPAPTYDDLVRQRRVDLGPCAVPRERVLELFAPE